MRRNAIFCVMMIVLVCGASADRGSIPFDPGVEIFEPNQRAMICWNGKEEIMLLSTDLYASKPTKVLEVLPLPGEPEVKEGDVEVFKKAIELINSKIEKHDLTRKSKGRNGDDNGEEPAGEVTFHEKIGAHDISVTKVLDADGFVEWVENYLREQEVDNPEIPEDLKTVISEYLEEGYDWFVFDVVELSETARTNDAIQYKFKSDHLYYPLKIN